MDYKCSAIFSVSLDGSLAFSAIVDKDNSRRKENLVEVVSNTEVMIPKAEREKVRAVISQTKKEIAEFTERQDMEMHKK